MLNTKEVFPGFLRFSVRFGDCNTLCHLPSRAQVPPLTKENASTLQTCISSCMLFFGPAKSPKYGAVSFSGSYASMPGGIGRLMSEARIMLIESDMKRILGINMGVS